MYSAGSGLFATQKKLEVVMLFNVCEGILRLLGLNKFILTSDKVVLVNLKCDLIFLNETKVSMIGDW